MPAKSQAQQKAAGAALSTVMPLELVVADAHVDSMVVSS